LLLSSHPITDRFLVSENMPTEPVILVILDASFREIGNKERSRRKIRRK
jgi:hypothetical protein